VRLIALAFAYASVLSDGRLTSWYNVSTEVRSLRSRVYCHSTRSIFLVLRDDPTLS
jgi:hypothetical protein